ncbi:putative membrane protein [Stakelama sediminis]|uniref:Putative membrane protein n=1 Tax=Stakelama sediminis TaxID=463200 RepID=A0A840YUZ9_9SPHN|nr:putative membrane protein [Stakelama sediminis]
MHRQRKSLGNWLAPPRFVLFCVLAVVAIPLAISRSSWSTGTMIGFDIAVFAFLVSYAPLVHKADSVDMRDLARRNDANRAILLGITSVSVLAVLASVTTELSGKGRPDVAILVLVLATLILAWIFGNFVYALHYAHLFYVQTDKNGDSGGLDFPDTPEPRYWDFIYFAFTLGMTFQTSDTGICTTRLRRIVTLHSMAAFVFNLGVIAFTINVLGGS